jgi:hypothetical protein
MFVGCPLYTQKRTLIERVGMSALCQKRTFAAQQIDGGLDGFFQMIALAPSESPDPPYSHCRLS